jgi:Domain of unknown function (DUF4395)
MGVDVTASVTSRRLRGLFSFPNPVNEVSARLVAAGVVVMCVLTIALDLRWAPKRFAQAIGVVFSVTALILAGLGWWTAAEVFLGLLAAAAFLESALGLCLGCKAFAVLMRVGVVPEGICERCNDIWATHGATT